VTTTTHYSEEQQRVIDLDGGAYLLTAPPGSGKTQILVERSIRLLSESAGGSFRILALTFTTRAADELRERVALGVSDEWQRMTTCTFHAFALDVLRHYGERIGVGPTLTVFESQDDRLESLAQALADDGYDMGRSPDDLNALTAVLTEISLLKRRLVPPDAAPATKVQGIALDIAYQAHARKLRQLGAVDFDDLLLLSNRLLAEHPRIARHYRRMYRFVLVDEAQDTSRAQYELLRSLLGDEHRNVLMVADKDQAIFAFAGSDARYLRRFVDDFDAKQLSLTGSYRCATQIVAAAARLIGHNEGTLRPSMSTAGHARGQCEAVDLDDEPAEAVCVIAGVQRLLTDGLHPALLSVDEDTAVRPEEICVVGRSRYALQATLAALNARGVAHQFGSGNAGLFDTRLFHGVHYAMRVASNPRDLLSLENLVALLAPLDDSAREALRRRPVALLLADLAKEAGVALDTGSLLDPRGSGDKLDAALEPLRALAHGGRMDDEAERLTRDADTLSRCWRSFGRDVDEDERTLGAFLNHLSLSGRASLNDPGVRVLTIHAVKGLEFRAVFLVGMNEGTFPDYRSVNDPRLIEDERRNAYVAVTRAGRYLQLSRPRVRTMPWGDIRSQRPSRFLAELAV
jgi:DNA helicase-2/ATP-dependent DNA helicase PcrA